MLNPLRTFFDHSRHTLVVRGIEATLDVLAFDGEEQLSQPFKYRIEFTSSDHDIAAGQMLRQTADFSLHAAPHDLPPVMPWDIGKFVPPLRTLHGVITGFKRLSGSNDEARYEITLQPRLALLERGRQFRIYQHQSVPQIVESILRGRHDFEGQDFLFDLVREYPRREQVMQYGEDDLTFISRLLAEVGIWFRFTVDERLRIDVVEFHDDQRHYAGDVQLPYRTQSGLGSSGVDGVWQLQTEHQVVEQHVNIRAYHHRDIHAFLDGDVDQTRGSETLYGEAYHYAEPYTVLGDPIDQDEDLLSESGFFYARLRHERYLNNQTRLSGVSSSPTLALAQVLKISGGAPQAFAPGAVITRLITRAARDRSFEVSFEAMPYAETICFRPPLLPKPQIAGTVPARVTSTQAQDIYSHIDREGRYKVSFLFDRDSWKPGEESLWLRLARPYAGDTHGLHLPLICGTEVAIAFEQGDPDRPYIAHALHDNKHKDHVTLDKRDYTRNVLRTPANNKLRMEDLRGQEHVKLSTEFAGKSQLNLGHLVDAQKQKRGEGFELRTDGRGAIRGGKGVFISADEQGKAQGNQLDMQAAIAQLENALSLARSLAQAAQIAEVSPGDTDSQERLHQALTGLTQPGLLLHAPAGIGVVTPEAVCIASGTESVGIMAAHNADISAGRDITATAEDAVSVLARNADLQLKAAKGKVELHATDNSLHALAKNDIKIESVTGRVEISAPEELLLTCGGAYIRLKGGDIELGAPGNIYQKSIVVQKFGATSLNTPITLLPGGYAARYTLKDEAQAPKSYARYQVTTQQGAVFNGVTDKDGQTMKVHTSLPGDVEIAFPDEISNAAPQRPLSGDDLDEEEEEEELEGITLRLGLFFDGTGNNLSNSATTAQCQREDLQLFNSTELASIVAYCGQYGFSGFDGNWFDSTPDSSYGNAASNVVHLHRLYPDHATDGLPAEADIGYIKTYHEGIGTRSGGKDSRYGQATGRGETGVVARVEQAPALIKERLDLFQRANPSTQIRRVEFDIFGFSRGAAAARHCANELLKPGCGIFAELLKPNRFGLLPTFSPAKNVSLNLIGLFDTVAAIAAPGYGDLSVADADNTGVNLYLPPGCARKVIHLQARDEIRHNFALNSLQLGHQQISLPGVHSDVGGGYLPRAREKVLLTTPQRVNVKVGRKVESTPEWAAAEARADTLRATGLAGEGSIKVKAIPFEVPPQGKKEATEQSYMISVELDRPVRGELALIALRLMRELGVHHGVPFKNLDARSELAVPEDLKSIAAHILENALAGTAISLDADQERLLLARYIHRSAHWTPVGGLFINKPAQENRRIVHPHYPQQGYPK